MAQVTNTKASPALRGQNVVVTLTGAETLSKLSAITIGQQATIDSSGYVGYVSSIDTYGYSFKIAPKIPTGNLSSTSTPAVLAAAETITLA